MTTVGYFPSALGPSFTDIPSVGGMDAYVREFGTSKNHDEFYLNNSIINIFNNYTKQVVSRYVNSPAILAWELANDAR